MLLFFREIIKPLFSGGSNSLFVGVVVFQTTVPLLLFLIFCHAPPKQVRMASGLGTRHTTLGN